MTQQEEKQLIKEGTEVILDRGFANSSKVLLVKKRNYFSTVSSEGDTWDVMTDRLTTVKENE